MTEVSQSSQLSGRLFSRLYFVLVLSIIVIGSTLVYVVRQMDESAEVAYIESLHQPFMALLIQSLQDVPESQWLDRLNTISVATDRSVTLLSLQDFAADEDTIKELNGGELLVLFDHEDTMTLYQMVGQSSHVLAVDVPVAAIIVDEHAWVAPLFYLLIAVVVYVLIRPFAKRLLKLKDAAMDFGRGDFSSRLELPPSNTLAPIADAFNGMAHQIEHLLLTQRDLVNGVSHELRTPLARLKFGFEEMGALTGDFALQQGIEAMKIDVSELESLIDEMLRYAEVNQIEAFSQEPVPLGALINKLIEEVTDSNKTVSVVYEAPVSPEDVLFCHEHSMHRALANVMRNALSFSKRHCELCVQRLNGRWLIDISDDGDGLQDSNTERLFEPFYKINNNQRKAGYGLGLAIAHSIAKKHQGHLSVVQGSLKGACFRFDLPFG